MATPTVFDIFVKKFSPNLYTLAQQTMSKFATKVRRESVNNAEEAFFDTVGPADDPTQDTTYKGNTPESDDHYGRRKVKPLRWEKGDVLDKWALARALADLQSATTEAFKMSFARKTDNIIITAMTDVAYIGKEGTQAVNFVDESVGINGETGGTVTTLGTYATSNSTPVGLELAKMLAMMQIFNDANVDENIPKYWAVRPSDTKYMLNLTQVGSVDYNTTKPLVEGKVTYYNGFNFFWSTYIPTSVPALHGDDSCYRTLAWAEDGVILAYINELQTQMAPDPTKKFNTRIYSNMDLGAVRMEGVKVHECLTKIA